MDNLALEASIPGIDGWVAGSGIAFPAENQYFWELTRKGEWDKAREIIAGSRLLFHLDVSTKFSNTSSWPCRKPASARNTSAPRASR